MRPPAGGVSIVIVPSPRRRQGLQEHDERFADRREIGRFPRTCFRTNERLADANTYAPTRRRLLQRRSLTRSSSLTTALSLRPAPMAAWRRIPCDDSPELGRRKEGGERLTPITARFPSPRVRKVCLTGAGARSVADRRKIGATRNERRKSLPKAPRACSERKSPPSPCRMILFSRRETPV